MGFRDILNGIFRRTGPGKRFLFNRIPLLRFTLVIPWIFQPLLPSSIRYPQQIRRALSQHACVKRMAQGTLAFAYRSLHLILSNPAKDDLLAFIS
jgi:hypothetical protein